MPARQNDIKVRSGLRTVGFRFDNLSLVLITTVTGREPHEFDQIPKHEYMATWYYTAHWSYQISRNRKIRRSVNDVKRLIARLRVSEYNKISDAINSALVHHNKTIGGSGEKKK